MPGFHSHVHVPYVYYTVRIRNVRAVTVAVAVVPLYRSVRTVAVDGLRAYVCEALICKKALSVKNYRALISKSP